MSDTINRYNRHFLSTNDCSY